MQLPAPLLCSGILVCGQLLAQQDASPFDAPTLTFDDTRRILCAPDLDGDGDRDALGWWGQRADRTNLHAFRNDGQGGWSLAWEFDLPYGATDRDRWALEVGRFDQAPRDGFVARFGDWFVVYGSNADGTPRLLGSWGEFGSVGSVLAVADFDGNGTDDVIADLGSRVQVYLSGALGFRAGPSFALGIQELDVFDADGDGDPDVAASAAGTVTLLLNQQGVLTRGPDLAHVIVHGGESYTVTGDIDGDQDDDLVVFGSWGVYQVFRQQGGQFSAEASRVGGPATGLADLDGDGDLDGVCCGGGGGGGGTTYNRAPSTFHLCLNDGAGNFALAWQLPGMGAARLAAAADLDGDGDTDLLAGRVTWFDRGHTFAAEPMRATGLPRGVIQADAHDPEADGDMDVSVRLMTGQYQRYHNDGTARFLVSDWPRPAPPSGGSYGPSALFGDFDGDGLGDQVVALMRGGQFTELRLLRGLGNGEVVDAGPAASVGWSPNFQPEYGLGTTDLVADLDLDGDLDVVSWGGRVAVNDGSGFFAADERSSLSGWPRAAADIDADGFIDIVLLRNARIEIAWGHAGGYGGIGRSSVHACNSDQGRGAVAIRDLDADGDLDLALYAGSPLVMLQGASRAFASAGLQPSPTGAVRERVAAEDLDGDGIVDLVVGPAPYDLLVFYRGLGAGNFATGVQQLGVVSAELIDGDGDGALDLVGTRFLRNVHAGADRGWRQQYGLGAAGAGGHRPLLGARGPFRVGERVTTTLRGAPPNTLGAWLFALQRSDFANVPLPGIQHYASPVLFGLTVAIPGTASAAGSGAFELSYVVQPSAIGLRLAQQFHLLDPALPGGIGYSNGLEIGFGR